MYKDYIKWGSATVCVLAGLVVIMWSMILPPEGAIDGSVLTVIGELLTFAGAVFGISTHYAVETEKLKVNIDSEVKKHVDTAIKDKSNSVD